MELWKFTLAELVAHPDAEMPELVQPFDHSTIVPLDGFVGFATAYLDGDSSGQNQVLLKMDGSTWKCVGHYVDDSLTVFEAVRVRGLGKALFLRCIEHRQDDMLPVSTNFTRKGFKLVRSAHREAIKSAIKEKKPVRPEVLADYPDIRSEHI
jgi:hypothetical protein